MVKSKLKHILILVFWQLLALAQVPIGPRLSTEAETGFSPCIDTIKVMGFTATADMLTQSSIKR